MFLTFLIIKSSSDQRVAFCKSLFFVLIFTTNKGSLLLIYLPEQKYLFDFAPTDFILIVLWYVLLYLFTVLYDSLI